MSVEPRLSGRNPTSVSSIYMQAGHMEVLLAILIIHHTILFVLSTIGLPLSPTWMNGLTAREVMLLWCLLVPYRILILCA